MINFVMLIYWVSRLRKIRIASNYGRSRINAWSYLVTGGIQHHNKNKCQVSNKHLVQSLFLTIPGGVINNEVENVL